MADLVSREGRFKVFLAFLIVVLVVVNSQSLVVSRRARDLVEAQFGESVKARAEQAAAHLRAVPEDAASLTGFLANAESETGLLSACLFDANLSPVAGSPRCGLLTERSSAPVNVKTLKGLAESDWVVTNVTPPYDPERATVFGYLALVLSERPAGILRVEARAATLAEMNQHLRATLLYQGSGVSLLLVGLFLFVRSQLARNRRLMAEARSVAGELGASSDPGGEEGQFLLETFQMVVSRLKEKERQLAEMHRREKTRADDTEALATDIIQCMTTGLVGLDETGKIAVVNPAAERIFRSRAIELRGRAFSEALQGSGELSDWVLGAFSGGEFFLRRRVEYKRSGGDTIHLGASVLPLRTGGGALRGALCLFADLTEVIKLRERLILKENLARLGEVAAGIAHELRNSLATILGNAKLLRRAGIQKDAAALVDALAEEGASMSRVVSEFLTFARPERLRIERFDLHRMCSELVRDLTPIAAEVGVDLEVDGASVETEADELLVRKAVSNLILNAIQACEPVPGGNVVRINVSTEGSYGIVRVADEGAGIPEENLARIFTPFFTTKADGTGLGLAMVQKVAISHNGRIEVERGDRRGAVFTLVLPLCHDSAGSEEWV